MLSYSHTPTPAHTHSFHPACQPHYLPTSLPLYVLIILTVGIILTGCNQSGKNTASTEKSKPYIASDIPVFSADSAFTFVATQVDFGPRVNNTKAHDACAAFLTAKLREYSQEVVVQSGTVTAFDGTLLKFQNLIASFGPSGNNRILLGAHWDSRPYADHDPDEANFYQAIDGANDGASGVGVLLEVARQLRLKAPPIGVDIIFFDAEDYGPPEALQEGLNSGDFWGLGSQYWAKNPHLPDYYAKYGILLDMVGAAGATFLMEGVSMEHAPQVVKKVWDIGGMIGYSSYFLFQRGGYITDDHYYVIRDRGIPMIDIIHLDHTSETGMYKHWHTVDDSLDKIDPGTLQAVGQTLLTVIYSEK
ncbi:MAG: M28 family peptidase [Bacteroidales bacterium]|nr:M28 family peptidase [Bacteroidales bacterium]